MAQKTREQIIAENRARLQGVAEYSAAQFTPGAQQPPQSRSVPQTQTNTAAGPTPQNRTSSPSTPDPIPEIRKKNEPTPFQRYESPMQMSRRVEQENMSATQRNVFGNTNSGTQNPFEIAAREYRASTQMDERNRIQEFEIRGRRYQVDGSGGLVDVGEAQDRGQGNDIIAITQEGSKRIIGRDDYGRLPLQSTATGPMMRRDPATGQLVPVTPEEKLAAERQAFADATAHHLTDKGDAQARLQKYRDAGLMDARYMGGAYGISSVRGQRGAAFEEDMVSMDGIKNFDYAAELDLNPLKPQMAPNEDPLQYENRVLNWKIDNLSKAHNSVVGSIETAKVAEWAAGQQGRFQDPNTPPPGSSKSVIENFLEEKTGIKANTERAIQEMKSLEKSRIKTQVNEMMKNVQGSESVKKAMRESYEADLKEQTKSRIKEREAQMRLEAKQKTEQIYKQYKEQRIAQMAETPQEKEMKEMQQQTQRASAVLSELQNPATGQTFTAMGAQALAEKMQERFGLDFEKQDQFMRFVQYSGSGNIPVGDGASLYDTAIEYSGSQREAKEFVRLAAGKTVAERAQRDWLTSVGLDADEIIQGENEQTNTRKFLAGTMEPIDAVAFMSGIESEDPEMALFLYENALTMGEHTPEMKSWIEGRLDKMGVSGANGAQGDYRYMKNANGDIVALNENNPDDVRVINASAARPASANSKTAVTPEATGRSVPLAAGADGQVETDDRGVPEVADDAYIPQIETTANGAKEIIKQNSPNLDFKLKRNTAVLTVMMFSSRASDREYQIVEGLMNSGAIPPDATLAEAFAAVAGFNPEQKELGYSLLNTAKTVDETAFNLDFIQRLSGTLRDGRVDLAINQIEKKVLPDRELDEKIRFVAQELQEVRELADEVQLGPLAQWPAQTEAGRLVTREDQQNFNAAIERVNEGLMSFADIEDASVLQEITQESKLNPVVRGSVFKSRVDDIERVLLNRVNSERISAGLPALENVQQIYDNRARAEAYINSYTPGPVISEVIPTKPLAEDRENQGDANGGITQESPEFQQAVQAGGLTQQQVNELIQEGNTAQEIFDMLK